MIFEPPTTFPWVGFPLFTFISFLFYFELHHGMADTFVLFSGEIKVLRVVPAFSISSYQQDTVTQALPSGCSRSPTSVGRVILCKQRHSRRCGAARAKSPPRSNPELFRVSPETEHFHHLRDGTGS